jgi:hypothetical protein
MPRKFKITFAAIVPEVATKIVFSGSCSVSRGLNLFLAHPTREQLIELLHPQAD